MYGERLVICGAREGEEREHSGRGQGAATCAAGPPQVSLGPTAGAGGEEDVRGRGGVGEGRDLAGRMGEVGGAAAPVIRLAGSKPLAPFLASRAGWRDDAGEIVRTIWVPSRIHPLHNRVCPSRIPY